MESNNYNNNQEEFKTVFREDAPVYETREVDEDARLRAAINKSDTEKFRLFTRMLRITKMMQNAKITHKQA